MKVFKSERKLSLSSYYFSVFSNSLLNIKYVSNKTNTISYKSLKIPPCDLVLNRILIKRKVFIPVK